MSAPVQRSFADGELAPASYARTDLSKYARGARTVRNHIVLREGGLTNRPGMQFRAEAKDSAVVCRLIEFVLDSTDITDTYVLEFGARYIRFYQDGARIVTSGVAAWVTATAYVVGDLRTSGGVTYYCTAAHTSGATTEPGVGGSWQGVWYAQSGTIYEIPTPYETADLADIQYNQSGDVITLVRHGYAPQELRRISDTNWVLSLVEHGPAIDAPANLALGGGSVGTIRYWAVTAVMEGTLEESLPGLVSAVDRIPSAGTPTTLTWNAVANAISYNVYRSVDGRTYGLINSAGGTPVTQSDTSWTDSDEVATSGAAGVWVPAAGQARNPLTISATTKAYDGKYTIKYRQTIVAGAGGLGAAGRVAFYYSRDGEARVFAGYGPTRSIGAPGTATAPEEATIDVPDNGYSTLTIDAVPEVEQLSGPPAVCTNTVNTATPPDDSVAWWSGTTAFSDAGDAPELSLGPPTQQNLFAAADDFPATVTEYQQRRMYGNTVASPDRVWGSRIGSSKSFVISTPLQSDDAIAFRLTGHKAHVVKHLFDLDGLLAFTTAGLFLIRGDEAGILNPAAINPKRAARAAIGRLPPLEVADSALYVQARGSIVRDLFPVESAGGNGGYRGTNLSVYSAHLFKGKTIVDWAFAEEPFGIVWAVRSDGVLLGLTYLREFGIWGWHRHDTDGEVENVCVVPERDEDVLYLVVKRTINGATKRYIERLTSRTVTDIVDAAFMDSALTIDGRHTGVITMTLSGGVTWDNEETLTLTASAAFFAAGDVGNSIFVTGADGTLVRCAIEGFTSNLIVTVRPDRLVPAAMRAVAIGNGSGSWGKAIKTVTGLSHLEGKQVTVFADGYVVASPNNYRLAADGVTKEYAYENLTVAGGEITMAAPYMVIHVGLPYLPDLETLDLDSSGSRTTKDRKNLVVKVGLFLEDSRGVWAGRSDKWTATNPLKGLNELKPRSDEDYNDPATRITDYREITTGNDWNGPGRVFVRQVDPLPITILSVTPIGYGT